MLLSIIVPFYYTYIKKQPQTQNTEVFITEYAYTFDKVYKSNKVFIDDATEKMKSKQPF